MVFVIEQWQLREQYVSQALELMQKMDEIVGPSAHTDSGWCEHGRFFQLHERPHEIWMMYRWRSRPEHEVYIAGEERLLRDFYDEYCASPRKMLYFTELPVDVDVAEITGDGKHVWPDE